MSEASLLPPGVGWDRANLQALGPGVLGLQQVSEATSTKGQTDSHIRWQDLSSQEQRVTARVQPVLRAHIPTPLFLSLGVLRSGPLPNSLGSIHTPQLHTPPRPTPALWLRPHSPAQAMWSG